jgi:Tol biopolymer transport system component
MNRLVLALSAVALAAARAPAQAPVTLVSKDTNGVLGNQNSYSPFQPSWPSLSADDRWVAFGSFASNLVPNDTNGRSDVFVADLASGAIFRVSVDRFGGSANNDSFEPSISADGRFVAFWSFASDLVAGDTNLALDVFVHDRDPDGNGIFDEGNGVTTRASVDSNGVQGNGTSGSPSISADGRFVAFVSGSTNLDPADTKNNADVFLHDRTTGTTSLVSVALGGAGGNNNSLRCHISADGNFVAFQSQASDLVAGDANQRSDVFVRDLVNGTTVLASVDSSGIQGDLDSGLAHGATTGDGASVVFWSTATNLVANDGNGTWDVFVRDLVHGTTTCMSVDATGAVGNGASDLAAISGDGRFVVLRTLASSLFPGDTNLKVDIVLHDRDDDQNGIFDESPGVNAPMSSSLIALGDDDSYLPAISDDGNLVAFVSAASNLVPHDTNAVIDVFVRDRRIDHYGASRSNYGTGYPGTLGVPTISAASDPLLGAPFSVDVSNSTNAWNLGFLLVGFSQASIPTGLGGTLLVQIALPLALFPISPVGTSLTATLPADIDLFGTTIDLQAIEFDAGAAHGFSFTDGLELTLGI